jgi:hypothetical protein
VVVAFSSYCFFAVLDGFYGAPLQAGHALLAVIKPYRLFFYKFYIFSRADFGAYSAFCAGVLKNKFLVGAADLFAASAIEKA